MLCVVLSAALLAHLAAAQFGMPGMGMPEEPKAAAVKSDVQYIKCQACEAFVKQAYRHTKSKREGLKPGHKVCLSRAVDITDLIMEEVLGGSGSGSMSKCWCMVQCCS